MPDPVKGTFHDVILAIEKRNRNAPKLTFTRPFDLADSVVERFIDIFIDTKLMKQAMAEIQLTDGKYFENWVHEKCDKAYISKLKNADIDALKNASIYAAHIKPDARP